MKAPFMRRSSYGDLAKNEIVHEVEVKFAAGNQFKTTEHTTREPRSTFFVPKRVRDSLKAIIIHFEPTLNFGWLVPEYKRISLVDEVTEYATYYNIYPFSYQIPDDQEKIRLTINEWLDSPPPNQSEVKEATGIVSRTARDIAIAMSMAKQFYPTGSPKPYNFRSKESEELFKELVWREANAKYNTHG